MSGRRSPESHRNFHGFRGLSQTLLRGIEAPLGQKGLLYLEKNAGSEEIPSTFLDEFMVIHMEPTQKMLDVNDIMYIYIYIIPGDSD